MFSLSFWGRNIGIDLGTINLRIYLDKRGIIVNEPMIAAYNNKTNKVLAFGMEAKKMLERAPSYITVMKPIQNGVISDFELTEEIIRHFLKKVSSENSFLGYRKAVVGVPNSLTEVERKSVEDAIRGAGVFEVYLVDKCLAASLGARLSINEPTANMMVDMGGGATEIAILSMAGSVITRSLKIAGDRLNEDIIRFAREDFKLAIGELTAEEIKLKIGSAIPISEKLEMYVRGKDLVTGLPKEVLMKDLQVRSAMSRSLKTIVDSIREVLEAAPPELSGDILKRGIYISGGTSLLRGISDLIARELLVQITMVEDPITCVARGTGVILENLKKYIPILDNPLKPRDINI